MFKNIYYCILGVLIFPILSCNKNPEVKGPVITTTPGGSLNNQSDTIPEFRNINLGETIFSNGYTDQPYVVQAKDGSWICEITNGETTEGSHEDIAIFRSTDLKKWSFITNLEALPGKTGYVTSYGVPYITPEGRIYIIYNYNGDDISMLDGKYIRNDLLGWLCFKYSDDDGKTWSSRFRIPIRETTVDKTNNWLGKVQMFWTICKPIHTTGGLMFGFTKLNNFYNSEGEEGWIMNCNNIDSETDPKKLTWNLIPSGETGLRNPTYPHQEEHNLVQLNNNELYCVNRTDAGVIAYSISTDLGKNWTTPASLKYGGGATNNRLFKNPRACARIFKCKNNNYLLWFENNSTTSFSNRNPAWVSGGVEKNGTIYWSEPEILLYSKDKAEGMSYPDLIEANGNYYITETQKKIARIHFIPAKFLNDLWQQGSVKQAITLGLTKSFPGTVSAGSIYKSTDKIFHSKATNDGYSVSFAINIPASAKPGTVITNKASGSSNGVEIDYLNNGTLKLNLNDGNNNISIFTDQNKLTPGLWHYVSFTVDEGPGVVTAMVDGHLCDGGDQNKFGWVKFNEINDVNNSNILQFLPGKLSGIQLKDFNIYNRHLTTSEMVSAYLAEKL